MQGQSYHKTERECRAAIDDQKAHMQQLAQDANQSKMMVLEGTCISFVAKPPSKTI